MKYVILIHSNPDPWGHPTQQLTAEGRALSAETHAEMDREFEALLTEISASGELVSAEALGDPSSSTLFGWSPEGHLATDGPYAEAKEQLAGFFVIDCATRDRAEEIATQLRPARRHRGAAPGDVAGRRRPVTDGRPRGRVARVRAAGPGRPGPSVRRLRRVPRTRCRRRCWRLPGSGPTEGVPDNPRGGWSRWPRGDWSTGGAPSGPGPRGSWSSSGGAWRRRSAPATATTR